MKDENTINSHQPSSEALFRYQMVSQVLALEQQGKQRSSAINVTVGNTHFNETEKPRKVSPRTLYRWINAFEEMGFVGLIPAVREQISGSLVISDELLAFFKQQKEEDPGAGVPELIRRAKQTGLIDDESEVDRTTLWRSLKRMGVDTSQKKHRVREKRRFSYPHRMDMVLCDGKHFRAGSQRLKRVALFFIDDATRFVLNAVVGTSENSELFLRGLYETILHYGTMRCLYTDHGSGFVAGDCVSVLQQLEVLFIQGEAGYKEGRGKVERFNRTALAQCLRYLDGNPEVNPDCAALELRLRHYLSSQYNLTGHEGTGRKTPWECFNSDSRGLRFSKDRAELTRSFILHRKRSVSNDNVISFDGVQYEMPHGYEKTKVVLRHHLLENRFSFIHCSKEIVLHPVDLHANAIEPRSKVHNNKENPQNSLVLLPHGSAQLAFFKEYSPIVDAEGGFPKTPKKTTLQKKEKK